MKETYITEDEQLKCQKVANAFTELYEIENILVLDAGRYGFVKLQYYRPPQGFEDVITFTDSRSSYRLHRASKQVPHQGLSADCDVPYSWYPA